MCLAELQPEGTLQAERQVVNAGSAKQWLAAQDRACLQPAGPQRRCTVRRRRQQEVTATWLRMWRLRGPPCRRGPAVIQLKLVQYALLLLVIFLVGNQTLVLQVQQFPQALLNGRSR